MTRPRYATRTAMWAAVASVACFLAVLLATAAGAGAPNPWHSLSGPASKPDVRTYFRCNGTVGVYVVRSNYDYQTTVGISTVNPDPNCPAR